MDLNFGYIAGDGALEFGYTGAYEADQYPLILLFATHGDAHPNSVMALANFATTGDVDLGIVSDFDPAIIQFDWQAISDGQLWLQDISTLDAVTVNATEDTTADAVIRWRTPDEDTGQFTLTVNITMIDAVRATAEFPEPTGGAGIISNPLPIGATADALPTTGGAGVISSPDPILSTATFPIAESGAGGNRFVRSVTLQYQGGETVPRPRYIDLLLGQALDLTIAVPGLGAGASVEFSIASSTSGPVITTLNADLDDGTITASLSTAKNLDLGVGSHYYAVWVTSLDDSTPIARGWLNIRQSTRGN